MKASKNVYQEQITKKKKKMEKRRQREASSRMSFFFSPMFKTNGVHAAVGLFNNRSRMTSKCGKNNSDIALVL